MIKINEIKTNLDGEILNLVSTLEFDNKTFDLIISIKGKEYHKYAVTDRADAFLWAVLPYAMRHGHDIECVQPVTGQFLFNIETQYLPSLTKGDSSFYYPKIKADTIIDPVKSLGKVATGLSCGVDCLYTTIETYKNKIAPNLSLTHFCIFNNGAFGGSYGDADRNFTVNQLYEKELALAKELDLPVIELSINLYSLMLRPFDQFVVSAMGALVLALAKFIGVYHYSSSGYDYSSFTTSDLNYDDCSHADLLSLSVLSFGSTCFYSAGGAKTRFEKLQAIIDNSITKKHLHSCLNYSFNCGICTKCKRNLLAIDALGKLDEYYESFDIDSYKKNREANIDYLVGVINIHGHSYDFLIDPYNVIKKREPELIANIEKKYEPIQLFLENKKLKELAISRRKAIRAYKSLIPENGIQKVNKWFADRNIKNIILYSYSLATDIFVNYRHKLNVKIDYIVENVKESRLIPRLPLSTIKYPKTDAIIVCNMEDDFIIKKKLSDRTDSPIYLASEILDLRDTF